jgi:hypothetical protein
MPSAPFQKIIDQAKDYAARFGERFVVRAHHELSEGLGSLIKGLRL